MLSSKAVATTTRLTSTHASCWAWRALWEERKRRQKKQKKYEESGNAAWWNQATAPQPIHFRLLDAVLFAAPSSAQGANFSAKPTKPSMGVFTSRTGELLRRASASLEPAMVRGRMAQVSLGVFGHDGAGGGGGSSGGEGQPISVAHFADGSQRKLHAGSEWDRVVSEGCCTGSLLALTPFVMPESKQTQGLMRLRNTYRVEPASRGSTIGKVRTQTMRLVAAESVVDHSLTGIPYGGGGGGGCGGGGGTVPGRTPGGASGNNAVFGGKKVALVPSRSADANGKVDALTAQLVKLLEGTSTAGKRVGSMRSKGKGVRYAEEGSAMVRQISVDYIVQVATGGQLHAGYGDSPVRCESKGGGKGVGAKINQVDANVPLPGQAIIWMERVVSVDINEKSHDAAIEEEEEEEEDSDNNTDNNNNTNNGCGGYAANSRFQAEREEVYRQHKLALKQGELDEGDGVRAIMVPYHHLDQKRQQQHSEQPRRRSGRGGRGVGGGNNAGAGVKVGSAEAAAVAEEHSAAVALPGQGNR